MVRPRGMRTSRLTETDQGEAMKNQKNRPENEQINNPEKRVRDKEQQYGNIGKSTPGGYNKHDINEPRSNIDDDIVPPARGSRIDRDLQR